MSSIIERTFVSDYKDPRRHLLFRGTFPVLALGLLLSAYTELRKSPEVHEWFQIQDPRKASWPKG